MTADPFEEWLLDGVEALDVIEHARWRVGDWLLAGEQLGDVARVRREVAALVFVEVNELELLASVAAAFPPARRVRGLTWAHHRAALAPGLAAADIDAVLAAALAGDDGAGHPWSVTRTRREAQQVAKAVDAGG